MTTGTDVHDGRIGMDRRETQYFLEGVVDLHGRRNDQSVD